MYTPTRHVYVVQIYARHVSSADLTRALASPMRWLTPANLLGGSRSSCRKTSCFLAVTAAAKDLAPGLQSNGMISPDVNCAQLSGRSRRAVGRPW